MRSYDRVRGIRQTIGHYVSLDSAMPRNPSEGNVVPGVVGVLHRLHYLAGLHYFSCMAEPTNILVYREYTQVTSRGDMFLVFAHNRWTFPQTREHFRPLKLPNHVSDHALCQHLKGTIASTWGCSSDRHWTEMVVLTVTGENAFVCRRKVDVS